MSARSLANTESVITAIFERMKWQLFAERAPLQVNPEVWAAFQEQRPEFIRFFRAAQAALEVYGETPRMYQQVSGEAGYGARPGDLDGVRRDKHVQVEERAHCIADVREFSGRFWAMLAVL